MIEPVSVMSDGRRARCEVRDRARPSSSMITLCGLNPVDHAAAMRHLRPAGLEHDVIAYAGSSAPGRG